MKCQTVKIGDGFAVVCGSRKGMSTVCQRCQRLDATRLCDFPIGEGKTCDKALCIGCTIRIGRDTDYCRDHPRTAQGSLFA